MASYPVKMFSASQSRYLAEKIAYNYGKPLGSVTTQRFSDGELSSSFDESIRGCEVFIVQSTCPPAENLMELS
jgi:ribose-phosphate pyrophosphokinase